ncbi:DUF305 domain-containing protein [Streptomyces sp. NPDC006475]|uniref:DUF305 domain-containing protein n=1 Tax=Streptomyces sp. NPDC006475 TaxID=3155719 RepID=UPI0033BF82E6
MNNQALELLTLVGGRGGDPALKAWAASLAVGHRAELGRLNALLDRIGLPRTDVHAGHDMPGMVTAADLGRARTLRGAAFDSFLGRELRAHLEQSARVSLSESRGGTGAEARRLAADLAAAHTGALEGLRSSPR